MNDDIKVNETYGAERPRTFPWVPILAVAILALGGFSFVYENGQTENLRRQVVAYQQDNAALRSSLSQSDSELQTALGAVREELTNTRHDANSALAKAQASVRKHSDLMAGRIEKEQKAQSEQLAAELNNVKETNN